MSTLLRRVLIAGAFASLSLLPATLRAQALPDAADSVAFPRQFVKWIMTAQGDSAWAHAGEGLRGGMKSAAGVNEMAARIAARFGENKGTVAEVQFDEGEQKVYIIAMNFSLAPEAGAWIVAYSPTTKMVERSSFTSLTNIKTRYPNAKLP